MQSKTKDKFNHSNDDDLDDFLNEKDKRDKIYTLLLKNYTRNQRFMYCQRFWFKIVFFIVICLTFLILIYYCGNAILNISLKETTSLTDMGTLVGAISGILSSVIILPKVIAEHLFPKNGDNSDYELIKLIQQLDNFPDKESDDITIE